MMMKKLIVLLLLAVSAPAALAGLDSDPDQFGVYFDQAGNINCAAAGAFVPTNVYLLLSNPRAATNGWECTLTPVGVPYFILSTDLGGPGAGPCLDIDSSGFGFAVGSASNLPVVGGQIVLARLQVMLQAQGQLAFYISQATVPSLPGGLPVVTGDGILRQCGVQSGDVNIPVAGFNMAMCPVAEESSSFGGVKSLFR